VTWFCEVAHNNLSASKFETTARKKGRKKERKEGRKERRKEGSKEGGIHRRHNILFESMISYPNRIKDVPPVSIPK